MSVSFCEFALCVDEKPVACWGPPSFNTSDPAFREQVTTALCFRESSVALDVAVSGRAGSVVTPQGRLTLNAQHTVTLVVDCARLLAVKGRKTFLLTLVFLDYEVEVEFDPVLTAEGRDLYEHLRDLLRKPTSAFEDIPHTDYRLDPETQAVVDTEDAVVGMCVREIAIPLASELELYRRQGLTYRLQTPAEFQPYPLPESDLWFEPWLHAVLRRKRSTGTFALLGITTKKGLREPTDIERTQLRHWDVASEDQPLIEL